VVAIRTNTSQTPDPTGTLADILSALPADVALDFQVVPGTVWDDTKTNPWSTYSSAKTWEVLTSGLTGWAYYQRPT
jgi:hypothetical protein